MEKLHPTNWTHVEDKGEAEKETLENQELVAQRSLDVIEVLLKTNNALTYIHTMLVSHDTLRARRTKTMINNLHRSLMAVGKEFMVLSQGVPDEDGVTQ